MAQGYSQQRAEREQEYRMAGNGDYTDAGFTPEESAANVQQRGLEDHALDRFQNRSNIDPTRAIREPWLLGEPVYMPRDIPTGDVEVDGQSIPLSGYPGLRPDPDRPGEMQAFDEASHAYYSVTPDQVAMIEGRQRQGQKERQARVNREADPKYQAEYAAATQGAENVPAWLANLTQGDTMGGLTYAVGAANFLDPMTDGIDRNLASQAGRDAWRDRMDRLMAEDPLGSVGMQLAGGLLTPGLKGAGDYIAGGTGVGRLGRAAAVGAGYGAASGGINATGNLGDRIDDVAVGGLTGAGVGAVGQGVVDRLSRGAGVAGNSAARRLSRRGVNLTPGQMMSEVPVIGSTVKYAEDLVGGFNPLMNGVRRSQNEDVIRAAGAEALAPIGGALPRNARTGYQVSQNVMRVLGDGYDRVTSRIAAQADQPLFDELADLTRRAGQTLDESHSGRLERILRENVLDRFEPGGRLSGDQFKRIETTLRQQSERANRPNSTLEDVDLSEFLDESRDIVRNLIARQFPQEAEDIANLNRGYAVAKRIQRAVSGSAQVAREGTPTPGELTNTVVQMANDGQVSGQRALLQGLAGDARTVLPSGMGDTGSGQRATLGALGVLGTGGAAVVNPALAAGIATGAVVYSKPGIAIVNFIYRLTDSREAGEALALLARAAQRDPALLPYYEAASQHVLSLGQNQSPASQPAPQSEPLPMLAR
jgi:predicted secreted protein